MGVGFVSPGWIGPKRPELPTARGPHLPSIECKIENAGDNLCSCQNGCGDGWRDKLVQVMAQKAFLVRLSQPKGNPARRSKRHFRLTRAISKFRDHFQQCLLNDRAEIAFAENALESKVTFAGESFGRSQPPKGSVPDRSRRTCAHRSTRSTEREPNAAAHPERCSPRKKATVSCVPIFPSLMGEVKRRTRCLVGSMFPQGGRAVSIGASRNGACVSREAGFQAPRFRFGTDH